MSDSIDPRFAQLIVWKACIKLEMLGLKHSGGSVTARVKRHFGWKGNRQKILDQLITHINTQIEGSQQYVD